MSHLPAAVTQNIGDGSPQRATEDIAANDVKPCVTNPIIAPISELPPRHEAVWSERNEGQNSINPCVTEPLISLKSELPQTYETFIPKGPDDEQSDVKMCVTDIPYASNCESLQESQAQDSHTYQSQIDIKPHVTGPCFTPRSDIPGRPEAFPIEMNDGHLDIKPCVTDLLLVSNVDTPSGNQKVQPLFPVYLKENEVSKSFSVSGPTSNDPQNPVCKEELDHDSAKMINSNTMTVIPRPDSTTLNHSEMAKLVSGNENLEIDIASEQKYRLEDIRDSKDEQFKCDQCDESFYQENQLEEHMKSHNAKTKFKCEECGKGFARSSYLTAHKCVHTGEKPYKCDECGKCFRRRGNMIAHTRLHTGEKQFKCDECGKNFLQVRDLLVHMDIHTTSKKPVKSKGVYKKFTMKLDFQRHVRTHSVKTVFKCHSCGKNFSQRDQLDIHLKTHSIERHHKCYECGRSFKTK